MELWEMRQQMQEWVRRTELLDQNLPVEKLVGYEREEPMAPDFYTINEDGVEVEYTDEIKGIVLVI